MVEIGDCVDTGAADPLANASRFSEGDGVSSCGLSCPWTAEENVLKSSEQRVYSSWHRPEQQAYNRQRAANDQHIAASTATSNQDRRLVPKRSIDFGPSC